MIGMHAQRTKQVQVLVSLVLGSGGLSERVEETEQT